MSEYFAPSEHLGPDCEKSADAYVHEISNQVTVILGISQLALEAVRGNLIVRKHIQAHRRDRAGRPPRCTGHAQAAGIEGAARAESRLPAAS